MNVAQVTRIAFSAQPVSAAIAPPTTASTGSAALLLDREGVFGPDALHDLGSISKSAVALLVGIAMARGLAGGTSRAVFDFFPDHADLPTPQRRALTLQHLLAMANRVAWDQDSNGTIGSNVYQRVSRRRHPPGAARDACR